MASSLDRDRLKKEAAESAVAQAQDGMIVGLGTGSTAWFAVEAVGRRVASGLRIVGIPTSKYTQEHARSLGIPLSTLAENPRIDLTIDGADEVELDTLNLIKGGGGALLREKIVASNTTRLVIVVDETKLVERLGAFPLPVEVVPFGWQTTAQKIANVGAAPVLRTGPDGKPYVTDSGHYILDCRFGPIASPRELDGRLNGVVGVVEHGLFVGMASEVIVAGAGGVRELTRSG
ncbi:MAG TPA: ribose-5-phosphate isomerase RpiA [Terriglobia bacterium]|nr:ribose-5-phosphate isomerase RpiA [Terriglobia bacterium]